MVRRVIGFIICILSLQSAFSQVPARPDPPRLYNNLSSAFPDFLSAGEAQSLEDKLQQFSNETSNQVCVVIVDSYNGTDASSYATELGTQWGVGKKDFNNGVVILIKPTQDDGGRSDFIAVGYGLEGAIPDLATKRVRDEELEPLLKQGQYYAALDKATDVLMKLAKGEINQKDYTRNSFRNKAMDNPFIFVVIILVIVFVLKSFFGRGGGGSGFGGRGVTYFGGFGGGSSWGGGSGGGGGWGGFGGGSFGGGGSGGKW